MSRSVFLSVVVLVVGAGWSFGQAGDPDLVKALALEKALQKIIQQNEASIACILVSRSEAYQEFGQGPDANHPGKLRAFSVQALRTNDRFNALSDLTQKRHWQKLLDFSDPDYKPRAFGSGVVIDPGGLILTNYHVVQGATKVFVRLPGGKSSYADIHAADARCDLAVLKLLTNIGPLKAIALGDADKAERGQFLLTLANPFAAGFRDGQPSASWGILSNIRRRSFPNLKEEERVKPFNYYGTLLQTDARLHLGSSGGAMLNLSGEMIGLLTSVAAIQGGETPGGFGIPVNGAMRRIIEVLKRGEEIDYGFLGIRFDEFNDKFGVTLGDITMGSPADLDGHLKKGDVLLSVNGSPINDIEDVFTTIGANLAGAKVRLNFRRKALDKVADVTLAKLLVPGGKNIASSLGSRPFFRGLRVDYASLVVQDEARLFASIPKGVLVTQVQPGSSAERANIKAGDIIMLVNGASVGTPAAFYLSADEARERPIELSLYGIPNKLILK